MIGLHEQLEVALAGRYEIERELGRGGMAIVYLARDLKHGRRVAVKVLRPELATSLGAERFLREINVAARLSHPNVVPLYDSGEADELLYYVMPFVEGESLRDRLDRERQLPIDEALGIARQIAAALDYAHVQGVVHRDIKPENILLRADQVLVADFGLASALNTAASTRLTKSGMAVGTPAYMSPEQASADRHVDGRADVYSLGCVIFEMIAGVPPFRGATAQAVIAHHVTTAPPSLCSERSTCPDVADRAVRRALAKVPADRFRTAGEFLRAADASPEGTWPVVQDDRGALLRHRLQSYGGGRAAAALSLFVAVATVVTLAWLGSDLTLGDAASGAAAHGPIRVVMVPLVRVPSTDTVAAAPILSEAANVMRMFNGIVGIPLPSAIVNPGDEDETVAAGRTARAHRARYAAVFGGGPPGRGDLIIDVVDAQIRRPIAKIRVSARSGAGLDNMSADAVLGILRAIAPRDSLFPASYRSLLQASGSSQAIARLAEGQQRFGIGDIVGARRAYGLALAADSGCLLAVHRLSVLEAWEFRFAGAYDAVETALRHASGRDDAWTRLLRAQRLLAMRRADSAIAAFAAVVADDPNNIDGWFGLSQSMYYFGWVAGHSLTDARAPLDRVLALDSTFAPVHGQLVDVALAARDTAAARAALGGIGLALDWRPAKDLLVRYATGSASARDSVLRRLDRADHFTLSELVLQLSRTLRDVRAADRAAAAMESPRMPPRVRRRGAQYRLALAPALGRGTADQAASLASTPQFDPWVAAAALAGIAAERRPAIRAAARSAIPGKPTAEALVDPASTTVQAIEFLVQDALDNPSSDTLHQLERIVRSASHRAHLSNPTPSAWRASIDARSALTQGDTAAAIELLREATARVAEPYGAFLPLASLPTQRRLLLRLLRAKSAASTEIEAVESSFRRSWSISDAMYAKN